VRTRTFRRLATLVVATLLGLLGTVALAVPASAHAVMERSTPADGSRLENEPGAVSLTFDEAVQAIPASDEVISTTGARVDTGAHLSADGATLVLPLRPGLPVGTYTAVWRVVSADTHVVSGSITFGLGVDPAAVPEVGPEPTTSLDLAAYVADGLVYAGMVLLVGVTAAAAVWWPWALGTRRLRATVRTGWLLAVVGTAAALLLQGPRAVDAGWAGVAGLAGIGETFGGAFGWELVARLLLLVLVLPLMPRLRGRVGAAVGVALLVTVALTGHEAVGDAVPLAMTAAVLHLAAMCVWLGGLVALLAVVGRDDRVAASLRTWSPTAYGCVAVLVVTGEYQASRQLAPLQALWTTSYGVVLLVKLLVVAAMVAAAAFAQRRVQAGEGGDVVVAVRRSVRVEAALAVVVVAVTAVLVSEPPGSTTYGPPVTLAAPLGPDSLSIGVDSTLHGRQRFTVDVLDASGAPAPVQTVTATLSSATVASLAVKLTPAVPGGPAAHWTSAPLAVPEAGVWTVHLDVGIDQADAYATTAAYRVR
jgi:copper transport protein